MQPRLLHRHLCLAATVLLAVLPAHARRSAAAARASRFGVLTTGHDAAVDAVLAGVHEGFGLAGMDPDMLEKSAAGDESLARAAAMEFTFEGIDVVFAIGPEAALVARDALREPTVVFAAVGYPEALGLPGRGNVCGVADGAPADEIVDAVRRVAPSALRLGLLVGTGAESRHIVAAVRRAATADGLEVVRLDADAEEVAQAQDCDAIWVGPGIDARRVELLARALEGRRVALVGSRRGHLDAGCSVVLRTDPVEVGLQAAALARGILDGAGPEELGVRHVHRRRLEIDLDAARRLGHEIPLPVLASADHLAPAFGRRR